MTEERELIMVMVTRTGGPRTALGTSGQRTLGKTTRRGKKTTVQNPTLTGQKTELERSKIPSGGKRDDAKVANEAASSPKAAGKESQKAQEKARANPCRVALSAALLTTPLVTAL